MSKGFSNHIKIYEIDVVEYAFNVSRIMYLEDFEEVYTLINDDMPNMTISIYHNLSITSNYKIYKFNVAQTKTIGEIMDFVEFAIKYVEVLDDYYFDTIRDLIENRMSIYVDDRDFDMIIGMLKSQHKMQDS